MSKGNTFEAVYTITKKLRRGKFWRFFVKDAGEEFEFASRDESPPAKWFVKNIAAQREMKQIEAQKEARLRDAVGPGKFAAFALAVRANLHEVPVRDAMRLLAEELDFLGLLPE